MFQNTKNTLNDTFNALFYETFFETCLFQGLLFNKIGLIISKGYLNFF